MNPPRSTVEVAIPDALQDFVTQRLQSGEFDSPAEYLQMLVRADRILHKRLELHRQRKEIESLLLAGLQSGDAGPVTAEHFDALRKRFQQ